MATTQRLRPGLRVIVGGNHASAFPERWLERGADYVIVREGERSFPALMTRLLVATSRSTRRCAWAS